MTLVEDAPVEAPVAEPARRDSHWVCCRKHARVCDGEPKVSDIRGPSDQILPTITCLVCADLLSRHVIDGPCPLIAGVTCPGVPLDDKDYA